MKCVKPNAFANAEDHDAGDVDDQLDDIKVAQPGQKNKTRHRASVACCSCRDRRIRCVVPPGDTECTQCKRSGVDCVIKNDDERRRPISRAYMFSLTERIALLEQMLRDRGVQPPPANHPPQIRRLPHQGDGQSPKLMGHSSVSVEPSASPRSFSEEPFRVKSGDHEAASMLEMESESVAPTPIKSMSQKEGLVGRLLSTRGHLTIDQLNGRLRYFGPTTNCHVHSELGSAVDSGRDSFEHAQKIENALASVSPETHDYLMDLFWQHYNAVLHVLHKEAFSEDMRSGRSRFYSRFLHVCVLAIGFRFAERSRPDMQKIMIGKRESTLHRAAKDLLDFELQHAGDIPSIVSLLILGDLECGVGRDNLGWMYAGIAIRLAFDSGLHLDTQLSGLPQRDIDIRHMTLWACAIYDKYWSLFLGRPTSIKNSDLQIHTLAKQFERLGTCMPAGPERCLETQIYEALLDLMDMAGTIAEKFNPRELEKSSEEDAYLRMLALERQINSWYTRLPESLKFTSSNAKTAPLSLFLLHQQYHCALILLHRPFVGTDQQRAVDPAQNDTPSESRHSIHSRTVCTKNAIRIACIFRQHRKRFDPKRMHILALQHGGVAAIALVAALASIKSPVDRVRVMQYLECVTAALQDMSEIYEPAERMSTVMQAVMAELREESAESSKMMPGPLSDASSVPARRPIADEVSEDAMSSKRRHMSVTSQPDISDTASQIGSFTFDSGFSYVAPQPSQMQQQHQHQQQRMQQHQQQQQAHRQLQQQQQQQQQQQHQQSLPTMNNTVTDAADSDGIRHDSVTEVTQCANSCDWPVSATMTAPSMTQAPDTQSTFASNPSGYHPPLVWGADAPAVYPPPANAAVPNMPQLHHQHHHHHYHHPQLNMTPQPHPQAHPHNSQQQQQQPPQPQGLAGYSTPDFPQMEFGGYSEEWYQWPPGNAPGAPGTGGAGPGATAELGGLAGGILAGFAGALNGDKGDEMKSG